MNILNSVWLMSVWLRYSEEYLGTFKIISHFWEFRYFRDEYLLKKVKDSKRLSFTTRYWSQWIKSQNGTSSGYKKVNLFLSSLLVVFVFAWVRWRQPLNSSLFVRKIDLHHWSLNANHMQTGTDRCGSFFSFARFFCPLHFRPWPLPGETYCQTLCQEVS